MIEIQYDDRALVDRLNRLQRDVGDLTPAMRDIAAALEDSAAEAFDDEAAPDGTPWVGLAPATQAARERRRKWPGKTLQVSGRLAASITSDSDSTSAVAGTNVVYAALQQFGAKRGAFGRTGRGAPIPWGDVPARPFLGVSDSTRDAILDALRAHFGD